MSAEIFRMKRDIKLIRDLMLDIEQLDYPSSEDLKSIDIDSATRGEHLRLMKEAGFLTAIDASNADDFQLLDIRLTWEGHDFLDSVRDPDIWQKTSTISAKAGGLTADLLKGLAKDFLKMKIAELTGAM
jgi:Hypothetical protein (DUF2513)